MIPSALRLTLASLVFFSSALSSSAEVLVVDAAGGPGVDFSSLQEAIDFAAPGDAIQIAAGTYPALYLDKGIALLGQGDVTLEAGNLVRWIAPTERVVLAGLRFGSLELAHSDGVIVLSELTWGGPAGSASELLRINDCADVRARDLTLLAPLGTSGVRILNSRFEGSDCRITGGAGSGEQCGLAGDGYAAMLALQSSQVLLSQSTLTGGDGGWNTNTCGTFCLNGGGAGAPALRAGFGFGEAGTEVRVSGSGTLTGGEGGLGETCDCDGDAADGVVLEAGLIELAGATLTGGIGQPFCSFQSDGDDLLLGPGAMAITLPADPALSLLPATWQAGTPFTVRLVGEPGRFPILWFGRRSALLDDGSGVEQRTSQERGYFMGPQIPPSGILETTLAVPAGWQPGRILFLQVELSDSIFGGNSVRSNSVAVVVR